MSHKTLTSLVVCSSLAPIAAFAVTSPVQAGPAALHAERDGKTFYFCSDHCRQAFVSTPAGGHSKDSAAGCC